jgi:ADP-heptose:LPS heptosyltransferase
MPERILISRIDRIGDVILTLPIAGALKAWNPDCEVIFLGRDYTRDVVALSSHIDEFISWDSTEGMSKNDTLDWFRELNIDTIIHVYPEPRIARLARATGIAKRIGASGRYYHYLNCNRIVLLSRRRSELHEAQLNFKLLKPITGKQFIPSFDELIHYFGLQVPVAPPNSEDNLIDPKRFNLILHPKSKGSAREWPEESYSQLIERLPAEEFNVLITGTAEEGKLLENFLRRNANRVSDLTGRFTMSELIAFINACDGVVAASTGPLHIAAALDKLAIGIYPPIKPMHPGRWAPIGKRAHFVVADRKCSDCRGSLKCHCMGEVSPEQVRDIIVENAR